MESFGYGRIGEIPHRRIWPDWGNTTQADMAGLGKYHTGGYGRIGVYRVRVHCSTLCSFIALYRFLPIRQDR